MLCDVCGWLLLNVMCCLMAVICGLFVCWSLVLCDVCWLSLVAVCCVLMLVRCLLLFAVVCNYLLFVVEYCLLLFGVRCGLLRVGWSVFLIARFH